MKTSEILDVETTSLRFWSYVDIQGDDECWRWRGRLDEQGYGAFGIWCGSGTQHRTKRAHRTAYMFIHGEVPDDLETCHRCDNPPCCNPFHLFIGTRQDNVDDCVRKGRVAKGLRLPQTRLTDDMVSRIRAEHTPYKVSARVIAERYGLCQKTVYKALAMPEIMNPNG